MRTTHALDLHAQDSRTQPAEAAGRSRRLGLLVLVLVFLSGVATARLPQAVRAVRGQGNWVDPIREVHALLSAAHADEPDADAMQRRAIEGMLEAINDPYAEYIPPDDRADFDKELTGTYSGIGAEIEIRDGWLTIVAPLEDSPALRAGLLPNDRVIRIGEESTFRLSAEECIRRLVGQEGTSVEITILRGGREITKTLTRQRIVARSVRGLSRIYTDNGAGDADTPGDEQNDRDVRWDFLIDPTKRLGYVRLSQFTPTAGADLVGALEAASAQAGPQGLAGLILDLRGNPGGSLEAAVDVADVFLGDAEVVRMRGRAMREQIFGSQPSSPADGRFESLPLVVLIDRISASASEIVAGALQDHNRALIVGSRTFGKGLVQSVVPLNFKRDAQVKFTTAKYYLPSGRLIQREDDSAVWGVDPTVGFGVAESDEQLVERIIRRRTMDAAGGVGAESKSEQSDQRSRVPEVRWSDPVWIETEAADRALAAAHRALRGRIETGAFEPLFVEQETEAHQARLATEELRRLERAERIATLELARIAKRIEALSGEGGPEGERDGGQGVNLWSDELNLTGGLIEVRDADGNVVSTLRITGRDVERWLLNADVKPLETESKKPEPVADPTP
ncbi:MAG: S41 family peptidase [Phycisphaeraceae bacterium]|nr:S41 family peptidase [Phycisphaeraceae bacterium]